MATLKRCDRCKCVYELLQANNFGNIHITSINYDVHKEYDFELCNLCINQCLNYIQTSPPKTY